MKKSMATQKNSSTFGSGVNVGLAGKEVYKKRMQKLFKDPPSDKNLGLSTAGVAGTKARAMAKQLAPIDPRTGMPIQPQMTTQPNTVGMPGSMPMPDGMGHTLPEHGMQAGGRHMSPYMQKKPKFKMRNYGGEDLPVIKSGGEFYLADEKYDNVGHGKFFGDEVSKLEGPNKRALKGKGKKVGNVRVMSEGGDPIFLQDTSINDKK